MTVGIQMLLATVGFLFIYAISFVLSYRWFRIGMKEKPSLGDWFFTAALAGMVALVICLFLAMILAIVVSIVVNWNVPA